MRLFALALWFAAMMGHAFALTPLPRPAASEAVPAGRAGPFVGRWSMVLPTMEVQEPDAELIGCDRPVRIEAANERHIFYIAPDQEDVEPAIALSAREDGTYWEPIAGGPTYFTLWITADTFYLYDSMPEEEKDWGRPFVFRRCP